MTDTIQELQQRVACLHALLDEPHPGLSTWNHAVGTQMVWLAGHRLARGTVSDAEAIHETRESNTRVLCVQCKACAGHEEDRVDGKCHHCGATETEVEQREEAVQQWEEPQSTMCALVYQLEDAVSYVTDECKLLEPVGVTYVNRNGEGFLRVEPAMEHMFHRLWTECVGTPAYDKQDWRMVAAQLRAAGLIDKGYTPPCGR